MGSLAAGFGLTRPAFCGAPYCQYCFAVETEGDSGPKSPAGRFDKPAPVNTSPVNISVNTAVNIPAVNSPTPGSTDRKAYQSACAKAPRPSHRTHRRPFVGQGGPTENDPPMTPVLKTKNTDGTVALSSAKKF
jgi:hypothetical protein